MIPSFNFSRIPYIIFGAGKIDTLYELIPKYGKNILFVIGERSLKNSGKWDEVVSNLENKDLKYFQFSVSGEPSPTLVDNASEKFRDKHINLVVSIGGGSVTDAGKAISAMIPKKDSIRNYLEGVGNKSHDGEKLPFIAIPTTSGTGSEATKNAVISEISPNGFKKSLRHDNLIPDVAIIDPELMISCPSSISAACGMDAFTQLLEAYVSPKGNPMTEALAFSGMKYINQNLLSACSTGASKVEIRTPLAYGSLISGIVLANAGLGIIHGLASPIGGYFDIPHATKMNINKLKEQSTKGKIGLRRYAEIGALLENEEYLEEDRIPEYYSLLIKTLEKWTELLKLEKLGNFGIKVEDLDKIIAQAGLKNNPVSLDKEDIKVILVNRL
ncbi:MAG: iron-containing alcohol dehydrogenase [Promethearchaeota archaeon]|jgi:alcohol dehydrogenase